MIDNLKRIDSLDIVLSKMKPEEIEALYFRVFSSADGELVLQDLANRCYVYAPTEGNQISEGMRAMYVSIIARLLNAVSKKEVVE